MSTTTAAAQFVGDIPRFYDKHLGPIIFQDYAADLARRAAAAKPHKVLELAAGTGVSTVALRNALPKSVHITATDLNADMLEIARAKLPSTANVAFQHADAMALPFAKEAFDLVAIQFGVMFFPDKPAAFAEARRVLKRNGTLLFNVWSKMGANPFAEIAHAAGVHFLPDNPPKFYLTPFGYADTERVRADLEHAGFKSVTHEVLRTYKEVRDWRHFAQGAVYGNPMLGDLKAGGIDPDAVVDHITAEFTARFGAAPSKMPLEAIIFSAR
jgi:ubiquinone/menaquinone biosynthesis C-methylase UbiE